MFPIDHFFLLPILQFIVSFPVSSPAMNDETCLVHTTFLIVYYTQVPNGHIATLQLPSSPNALNNVTHNHHTADL